MITKPEIEEAALKFSMEEDGDLTSYAGFLKGAQWAMDRYQKRLNEIMLGLHDRGINESVSKKNTRTS